MTSFSFECRDEIRRKQVLIVLIESDILNGFDVHLTGGFFPSVTISRESKISKREANRILKTAKAIDPENVFI
jgi:hypothetical protein